MKLFFRTIGEGTPLIILHGLWGASENWLPIAHLLEDKFQVYRMPVTTVNRPMMRP